MPQAIIPVSPILIALCSVTTASHAIDWPAFMAENDLVWEDGISPDYYDGAFIGDGMQGAMIMRDEENADAVRMLLGHYNAIAHSTIPKWEYCNSRVFAGNIMIVPTGGEVKHTMRLDLWNATATTPTSSPSIPITRSIPTRARNNANSSSARSTAGSTSRTAMPATPTPAAA